MIVAIRALWGVFWLHTFFFLSREFNDWKGGEWPDISALQALSSRGDQDIVRICVEFLEEAGAGLFSFTLTQTGEVDTLCRGNTGPLSRY